MGTTKARGKWGARAPRPQSSAPRRRHRTWQMRVFQMTPPVIRSSRRGRRERRARRPRSPERASPIEFPPHSKGQLREPSRGCPSFCSRAGQSAGILSTGRPHGGDAGHRAERAQSEDRIEELRASLCVATPKAGSGAERPLPEGAIKAPLLGRTATPDVPGRIPGTAGNIPALPRSRHGPPPAQCAGGQVGRAAPAMAQWHCAGSGGGLLDRR